MDKKSLGLIAGLFCFSATAQAALIQWTYEATISQITITDDPLGIEGERATISLTFDDSDLWHSDGGLYFPTTSASASITGGHTVELNSANPAGFHFISYVAAITEAVGNASFVDLTIDGFQTRMGSFQGSSTSIPVAGERLSLAHLPTSIPNALFDYPIGTNRYRLVDSSVRAGIVPESTTLSLIGLGLVGIVLLRHRKQGQEASLAL